MNIDELIKTLQDAKALGSKEILFVDSNWNDLDIDSICTNSSQTTVQLCREYEDEQIETY